MFSLKQDRSETTDELNTGRGLPAMVAATPQARFSDSFVQLFGLDNSELVIAQARTKGSRRFY
jgi:hypothetical protein